MTERERDTHLAVERGCANGTKKKKKSFDLSQRTKNEEKRGTHKVKRREAKRQVA